jgi:hypothetical protein
MQRSLAQNPIAAAHLRGKWTLKTFSAQAFPDPIRILVICTCIRATNVAKLQM